MISRLITLFPLWVVLLSMVAYQWPEAFTQYKSSIPYLLGVVMLGMGMTLKVQQFAAILKRPAIILLGLVLQYLLMPLFAWLLSRVFLLPPELLIGMILVGASPGGTASNVICYLARGDVALSISLTTVTTLLAVIATPLLTYLYVGQSVQVPVIKMLLNIFSIVILPVIAGVTINMLFSAYIRPFKSVFPLISVLAIVLIIAIIVALNQQRLESLSIMLVAAVVLHNLAGLITGYTVARLVTGDEKTSRTIAIETGMQNSGLAVALAIKHFTVTAALPGALFSVWHNLSGAILSNWWSRGEPESRRRIA